MADEESAEERYLRLRKDWQDLLERKSTLYRQLEQAWRGLKSSEQKAVGEFCCAQYH